MVSRIAGVAWGTLRMALQRRHWRRPVRAQLARQILFTGIDAVGLILLIAVLAGISVVAQAQLWLNRLGQTEMLGSLLTALVAREIAPILVSLIVIGRSGTAVAAELAAMRVRGEIDVLDAQGVDPSVYLLLPRILGAALSVFGLTVLFIAACFGSGFLFASLTGSVAADPGAFVRDMLGAVRPADLVIIPVKTLLAGLLIGATCCAEGLSVKGSVTEVPQAVTRAVVRAIIAVVVVSAVVSVVL